jgi:hypothetical protein
MENCPICDKPFLHVDEHVWYAHAPGRHCWCGKDVYLSSDSLVLGAEIFRKHCKENDGYLAHYLECRLGAVVDGEMSDM